MQRHTALATAGVTCLGVALGLYAFGQSETAAPAPKQQPTITITATLTGCLYRDGKADARCTPGAVNPEVTQDNIHTTICVPGWTKTVRPPTSYTNNLKSIQLQRYGQPQQPKLYEEDHLIALELGGAPRNSDNLWPQLWNGPTGAHTKDAEENMLHDQLCSGTLALSAAQQMIVRDWSY